MHSHALQPTPLILEHNQIRVYAGFRDRQGVSRVGYVDLDGRDPTRVLGFSKEPLLDIGAPGAFDDNGVVPSALAVAKEGLRLYYAGYQIHQKVRFTVFGGLAISEDGGASFGRFKRTPVMDRTDGELLFRVPHSVILDGHVWRIWYGSGSRFEEDGIKTLPIYDIKYVESRDGIHFREAGRTVLPTRTGEYRLGRPYVLKRKDRFFMFFGASTKRHPYVLRYAESDDGVTWTRRDEKLNLSLSNSGFDSEMMAYPAVIDCEDQTYLFYNGNSYGEAGFGVAVLAGGTVRLSDIT
jgi:hypothetical protein